jgi:flagellar hook-length control protein FliK
MQAEAGYQDPALGWIGVRAEASGGAVHATLVPQSSDAAQALSGHMAGLHTYLAENRTPVETLTLASFSGDSQHFTGQNSGHHDTGQNSGQGNASEPALQSQSMTRPITGGELKEASISDEVFTRINAGIGPGGVHISVLA